MTKYAAESFNDNSSDSRATSSSLSESVNSQMTLEDLKATLIQKSPENVCIRDQEGYIACGPIVGVQRPEQPRFIIIQPPAEPLNPPFDKYPPKDEKPNWTNKPDTWPPIMLYERK
jgi:hypothetical protein